MQERVVIAHDQHWNFGRLPDLDAELQDIAKRRVGRQSAFCRALDYGPIGDGIRKGNADLNDVRSSALERKDEIRGGFQVGVAGGDEGNECLSVCRLQFLKLFFDSGHCLSSGWKRKTKG